MTVSKSPNGWQLSATARLVAPFDLITTKFELSYGTDWHPRQLSVEGIARGQLITLDTTFGLTTAMNDVTQAGQRASNSSTVSPRTIVIPNNYFAAYEGLAMRLDTATVGQRLPIYVAPEAETFATVTRIAQRRMVIPSGTVELREIGLSIANPSGPLAIELWVDTHNRLARLAIEAASLVVVREDLATVMAREEGVKHPGDRDEYIQASGFTLAATITPPTGASGRGPAVVLVPGSIPQNRDGTIYGVPMLGQLAGALADAGFLVVRYDKRGTGQSGGRVENAGLPEYADDVAHIVDWLKKRRDVDDKRIAVVGHSEGAAIAMIAADQQNAIAAIGLIAGPGRSGRDVTLEQQGAMLAQSKMSDVERSAKIALQQRVIEVATKNSGWDTLPPDVRSQANTAWFRSWLLFDPAAAMRKIGRRPILVLHGALDSEMPVNYANRLDEMGKARKNSLPAETRLVVVPGVNHLLVTAPTGATSEYSTLESHRVAPELSQALITWLKDILPAR